MLTTALRPRMLAAADSFELPTGKKSEDNLFDLIDPTKVNKHLQELMPGLTIKVFRTYNASITLSRLLKETDEGLDVPGKKAQVSCGAKLWRQ